MAFSPNFCPIKNYLPGIWPQFQQRDNFWTQNENVARFARNIVKWDFFCDFQTTCKIRGSKSTTFVFLLLDAYKDNFVALTDGDKVRGKVFRPNIECIDGYIHMTDTVMLDDSPPWTAISSDAEIPKPLIFMALISGFFTCIFIYWMCIHYDDVVSNVVLLFLYTIIKTKKWDS